MRHYRSCGDIRIAILWVSLLFWTCTGLQAQTVAFPGAEGYGRFATGGRGGKVMVVTHLEDTGKGSFREAAEAGFPRVVVFAVSGTIHLRKELVIKGNITIAGQTAPGDGICLADYPVKLGGDNMVIRYLRIRMGDRFQNAGKVDGGGADDALGGTRRKHLIIDHCSVSWSTDEVMSVYAGDSTTLQWNLIAEPLDYSYHFEEGDTDFEHHGYGGIWGGRHLTAHHNLFAHCVSRTPRFDGIRNAPEEFADFGNNVIYNWGGNNVYAGEGGKYNVINNYYKPGPATSKKVRTQIANPGKVDNRKIPFGHWFVSGNYMVGAPEVSSDNGLGVRFSDGTDADRKTYLVTAAFPAAPWNCQSARDAYKQVLQQVGASLPRRDTLDIRILHEVETGQGRMIDVQGGYAHGTPYAVSQSAWPALQSKPAPKDSDGDGMPDEWEEKHGLKKLDATDASVNSISKDYTNIELYCNSLVKH